GCARSEWVSGMCECRVERKCASGPRRAPRHLVDTASTLCEHHRRPSERRAAQPRYDHSNSPKPPLEDTMKSRRSFALSACALITFVALGLPLTASAQGKIEKPKVSIAVGGKSQFYYLPVTIAERLGYFKEEGLDLEIN